MKVMLCLVLALFVMGCGMKTPSERAGYRLACEALRADTTLPDAVTPRPIEEAQLHIGKNAGWVVLPYDIPGTAGDDGMGQYTVQLIRVARTWQQAPERMGRE